MLHHHHKCLCLKCHGRLTCIASILLRARLWCLGVKHLHWDLYWFQLSIQGLTNTDNQPSFRSLSLSFMVHEWNAVQRLHCSGDIISLCLMNFRYAVHLRGNSRSWLSGRNLSDHVYSCVCLWVSTCVHKYRSACIYKFILPLDSLHVIISQNPINLWYFAQCRWMGLKSFFNAVSPFWRLTHKPFEKFTESWLT